MRENYFQNSYYLISINNYLVNATLSYCRNSFIKLLPHGGLFHSEM